MERNEAIKKLKRMLGKQFRYEYEPRALNAEQRAEQKTMHDGLLAERKSIQEAMAARREELLKDAEYQRLCLLYRAADREVSESNGKLYRHKFTVGTVNGMFFRVAAQGDSWEEIFRKLAEAKK